MSAFSVRLSKFSSAVWNTIAGSNYENDIAIESQKVNDCRGALSRNVEQNEWTIVVIGCHLFHTPATCAEKAQKTFEAKRAHTHTHTHTVYTYKMKINYIILDTFSEFQH